jgi:hypothetical protein
MIYHRALAVILSDVRKHQRDTRAAKLHGRPLAAPARACSPPSKRTFLPWLAKSSRG